MHRRSFIRITGILSAVALLLGTSGLTFADPYGGGTYGNCAYSTSCPAQPAPTPTPTPTPPPSSGDTSTTDTQTNTTTTGATTPSDSTPPSDHSQTETTLPTNTPAPTVPPQPSSSGSTSHNSSGGGTSAPLPHRITPENFGGVVYQDIGHVISMVPAPVAYTFPYLLLLLALLLVIRLVWQTQREIRRLAVIADTAKREKALSLEKDNFFMLASHYLRTPITILKGNLELLQSLNTVPAEAATIIQQRITQIQEPAEAMLKRLSDNKVLNAIAAPANTPQHTLKSLLSPLVLVPLGIAIVLMAAIQFMLVDFEVISPNAVNFLAQAGIAVLIMQLFVSRFRARQIRRANRSDQERLLNEQRELDRARAELITGMAMSLNSAIAQLGRQLDELQQKGTDVSKLRPGFGQLQNIAEKFRLASQLEAQAVQLGKMPFASSQLISQVVNDNIELAKQKGVTIEVDAKQDRTLRQNQELLHMVVDALINNAVKFSGQDGVVKVVSNNSSSKLSLEIQDNGPGLSHEQIATLFKPFSRAESAETFNTEGLGFSLYLAKLITHYLGGDISIDSHAGAGTNARVVVPAA